LRQFRRFFQKPPKKRPVLRGKKHRFRENQPPAAVEDSAGGFPSGDE
jgi:hypothetical protein